MNLSGKKILVLCTTDNMIWQFLTPHINSLTAAGGTVECACDETGFWFNELGSRGYVMHRIHITRNPFNRANLSAYKQIKRLIKDGGFDIVYCHQAVSGMLGRLAGKKYKCKVVYVVHGFFFWKGCPAKNKLLYRTAEKWLAKKTDAMITMNEEDYAAALKMKAKRVYNAHGIGLNKSPAQGSDIRAEFDIPQHRQVVLTVSEFIARKNYPLMLEAIALTDATYIICGSGRDEESVRARVEELGISERVIFAGYRRDVCDFMLAADVMLHFAKHEGLPVAIVEAMSCGLPVVSSDIRGSRDLLCGGAGALLPVDSTPETIAHALKILLSDEQKRKKMGEKGKTESEKYRIENVLPEYDKVFEEL